MDNAALEELGLVATYLEALGERLRALITAARRPDHIVDADDMVGRPDEWQPIESAPKDGTPILAGSVNHECREVVCWQDYGDDGNEGWVNTGAVKDRFYANPRWFTHYQPLPAAPKEPK